MLHFLLTGRLSNFQKVKIFLQRLLTVKTTFILLELYSRAIDSLNPLPAPTIKTDSCIFI